MITARVIDDLQTDLVIGLQTLGRYNLIAKLLPRLAENRDCTREKIERNGDKDGGTRFQPILPTHRAGVQRTAGQRTRGGYNRGKGRVPNQGEQPALDGCEMCALLMSSMSFFGNPDEADSETDPFDSDRRLDIGDQLARTLASKPELARLLTSEEEPSSSDIEELLNTITFNGSETMREKIRCVCKRFIQIFRTTVRPEPAALPPMELEIDADKLKKTRSLRSAPRPQSPTKLMELKGMIEELLRLGVLRVSTAETGSQVLLVAKKGTKKLRFCIDFRAVNDATTTVSGWPIPNIGDMLKRLGAQRPKFFGVMDLTAGFHQAPLSESARRWTAFTTAFGMFKWNRVPMGLKGAPSYFQHMMMVHVLGDLLQKAVEVYLDDFIVFGKDEDEFVANVEAVFERCLKAKITLNPAKCRFGMEEIEYVGHTISHDGLSFERSRLDRILAIPKPADKGQMKIFLGACNYFHSHVKGMSVLEQPLQALCGGGDDVTYTKKMRGKQALGLDTGCRGCVCSNPQGY